MSFQFVERQKMQRTIWGRLKLWGFDFVAGLLAFFEIELGPLPVNRRKRK